MEGGESEVFRASRWSDGCVESACLQSVRKDLRRSLRSIKERLDLKILFKGSLDDYPLPGKHGLCNSGRIDRFDQPLVDLFESSVMGVSHAVKQATRVI